MAAITEKQRATLITMREALGSQEEVAALLGRERKTVGRFERKGGDVPLWYMLALPELWRRKQEGRKLSPV